MMNQRLARVLLAVLVGLLPVLTLVPAAPAAQDAASCVPFLVPAREVDGQRIGPEACSMVAEETFDPGDGRLLRRVEVRLSGTIEGVVTRDGPRSDYFTDVPDFVFPQSGNVSPRFRGIARYEADAGTGLTLFYPTSRGQWNGKLFVSVHGGGNYVPVGELRPRDPNGRLSPLQGHNHWVGLMLDKGYAVAHTMRSTGRTGGNVAVTLDDGMVLQGRQLSDHTGLILEMTQTAQQLLQSRLGQRPTRTYLSGHSGGGRMGHSINY
jgi:hypothetical protein